VQTIAIRQRIAVKTERITTPILDTTSGCNDVLIGQIRDFLHIST
jgi:hypothetical protein